MYTRTMKQSLGMEKNESKPSPPTVVFFVVVVVVVAFITIIMITPIPPPKYHPPIEYLYFGPEVRGIFPRGIISRHVVVEVPIG